MKKRQYHYTMCGLDNVWLENGFELHKTEYGDGVSIAHAEMLDSAIAEAIVCGAKPLNAKEFRFLRSQMDLTQLRLAGYLGCDSQTIARWEKGESDLNPAADRLIRLLYLHLIKKVKPDIGRFIWRLSEDRQSKSAKLVLKTDARGEWKPVAVA